MNRMPELLFLNKPEASFLSQVTEELTRGWKGGLLDLSGTLVVIPTKGARRRLHESLAVLAGKECLIPPSWSLPMQFLEHGVANPAPAPVEQLCWIGVLKGFPRQELRGLFPGRPVPEMDTAQAAELGARIASLRADLAGAGLTLEEASSRVGTDQDGREESRWAVLRALEKVFVAELGKAGFHDRIGAQLRGMKKPCLPKGVTRVVIAGVPDLPLAYAKAIPALLDAAIGVSVLIHDPESRGAEWFDDAGRPSPKWALKPIDLPEDRIHACADEEAMAESVAALCRASGGSYRTTAIGATSTELAAHLHDSMEERGMQTFNPAGHPLDITAIGRLLKMTLRCLEEGDFRSELGLIRHADVQSWLGQPGSPFGARQLERLDKLQREVIPATIDDLLARWPTEPLPDTEWEKKRLEEDARLKEALVRFRKLLEPLSEGTGGAPVMAYLAEIYGPRSIDAMPGSAEAASKIREWILSARRLPVPLPSREVITLLLGVLSAGAFTGEKPEDAMEVQGWLELLWDDAPHLVIAGMNDGLVPEVRPVDPFLPEKTRESLGMPRNELRFVRDCYLIHALTASRPEPHGRVDFLLSRHDGDGSFLKPSRLLLKCRDVDLPGRVELLFRNAERRPGSAWRPSWRLKAGKIPPPDHVSASSVREYLSCPSRFFFKKLAKLEKQEFGIEEVEATAFGDLLHKTLQRFGSDPALRDLIEEKEIGDHLETIWRGIFRGKFGSDLSLSLLYQQEIGVRRLRKAAEVQTRERRDGWKIFACELEFEGFRPVGLDATTMPLPLTGRIDRVDFKETSKGTEWRILDYKSGEKAEAPEKTHYKAISKLEDKSVYKPHELMTLTKTVKAKKNESGVKHYQGRWIDLQLPIYVLLGEAIRDGSHTMQKLPIKGGSISVGYFLLPANLDDTDVKTFTGFDGWQRSAAECLAGVSRAISEGVFWPPRRPKYDDFENLFFDRINPSVASQQTVDPGCLGAIASEVQKA
jgi:ATP-dependent helicase/nuclease subunit B